MPSTLAPETSIFGAVGQLPRGPHGLSRKQVESSQRKRLLAAIAELVAEKGYAGATITEVARRAGVSPNVFYEHFAGKEECLLAAYDVFASTILSRMGAAIEPTGGWHDFVTETLDAYLAALDAEPEAARAFLIEIRGAGPRARRHVRQAYVAFAELIKRRHEEIRRLEPSLGPLPDRVYLGLAIGVRELVCDALESSEQLPLTQLAPDIRRWITATVQGAAAAGEGAEEPARRSPLSRRPKARAGAVRPPGPRRAPRR